jgi:hypothetical protein
VLLNPENIPAFANTEYLSLYHNKLSAFDFAETVRIAVRAG